MRYIRLIVWLKWKLTWRVFSHAISAFNFLIVSRNESLATGFRSRLQKSPKSPTGHIVNTTRLARNLNTVIAILVVVPFSIASGVVCTISFVSLKPPEAEQLLYLVLFFLWVSWLFFSLMGYAYSDIVDNSKLLLYPLTFKQYVLGQTCAAFLDIPVWLLFPVLVSIVIGFTNNLVAGVLITFTAVLFLLHLVSLSSTVLILSNQFLNRRRFREFIQFLTVLLSVCVFISLQFAFYLLSEGQDVLTLSSWLNLFDYYGLSSLYPFPSVLAAKVVVSSSKADYIQAFVSLLTLLVITTSLVIILERLARSVYSGRLGYPRYKSCKRVKLEVTTSAYLTIFLVKFISVTVASIMIKELRYFIRHPYFKHVMGSIICMMVAPLGLLHLAERIGINTEFWVWVASMTILLPQIGILFNVFGYEGTALPQLLIYPCPRSDLIRGKNLAFMVTGMMVNTIHLIILCGLFNKWHLFLPLLLCITCVLTIVMATGVYISLWIPFRQNMRSSYSFNPAGLNFTQFGFFILSMPLFLPVGLTMITPVYWISMNWYVLTIPLSFLYTLALYRWFIKKSLREFSEHEFKMILKLRTDF